MGREQVQEPISTKTNILIQANGKKTKKKARVFLHLRKKEHMKGTL